MPVDIKVFLNQVSGSATSGFDFDFDPVITIDAGATSASGSISILKTGDIEGDDDFTIGFSAGPNASMATSTSFSASISDDYINDVMAFTFDWAGSYTYEPVDGAEITLDYCGIDFDFYIVDSGFNFMPPWDAATSSCPESFELSGLADGTYYLVSDLYQNNFAGAGVGQDLPITVSYSQEYFDSGSFVFNAYNTDDSSGTYLMGQVDVANGYEYTITGL
jgi:hypothetical protein